MLPSLGALLLPATLLLLPSGGGAAVPKPSDRTDSGLPCMPRPAVIKPGMPVHFTYYNDDESLCARCNGTLIKTEFQGRQCGMYDDLIWDTLETRNGTNCNGSWNSTGAPEYTGAGCGVAPVDGGQNNCGANITAHLPMAFCPPAGFALTSAGGGWLNGSVQGNLSVDACAAACRHAAGCRGFTVSECLGCELFRGGDLQAGLATRANDTSGSFCPNAACDCTAYVREAATEETQLMISPRELPQWYLDHRTHAHTRLSVNSFCHHNASDSESSGIGGAWACADVFENAGKHFASLGVPAYVRHSHTGNEGLMWKSSTAPRAGWHPLVQDTGRNLPREFLLEAKAAGVAVIFYHYMKCQPYFAELHPEWVQRKPNGSALGWSRCPNGGLSTCVPEWRQTYIRQILELVEVAAAVGQEPAFYFDEFPSSPTGDFNPSCRKEFEARYGYAMPEEPTQDVLAFNQAMTQEYFAELTTAIREAAPRAAALVSITFAPSLDNHGWMNYTSTVEAGFGPQDVAKVEFSKGLVARPISSRPPQPPGNSSGSCTRGWSPPVAGRSPGSTLGKLHTASFQLCQEACCAAGPGCLAVIYTYSTEGGNASNCILLDRTYLLRYNKELQCLSGSTSHPVVANRYGGGVAPSVCPKAAPPPEPGAPIDPDILLSWAWALGRGASEGRPPHTWIPDLRTPQQAECAVAALRAYGHVANPDHTESKIPNVALYGDVYKKAAILDGALAGSRPAAVRYAAVVHSEKARNAIYASPQHPRGSPTADALAKAWKDLLYPAAGMWQALIRGGIPAAIVPDWLLERNAAAAGDGQEEEYRVLLAPAEGYLENSTEAALARYKAAGVVVVRAAAGQDWEEPGSREAAGRRMLDAARAAAGEPRVSFLSPSLSSEQQPMHVVAYDLDSSDQKTTARSGGGGSMLIHVLNDFTWCSPSAAIKVPPPAPPPVAAGTTVVLRAQGKAVAKDVLTGDAIATRRNGTSARLELVLPSFRQSIVVRVDFS